MALPSQKKSVLISGCGIAGPTLAYWLLRRGYQPAIVERAPKFREGGYIVDFWGVGFDVAERMGLVPKLREAGYVNDNIVFVRRDGRVRSSFGGAPMRRALGDRFLSIRRGDLARIVYDCVRDEVETSFDEEVTALVQLADRTLVTFKSGRIAEYDLVVGAGGLHSGVRNLAFASGARAERYLGYYAAVFVAEGYTRRDEHTYLSFAAPGRQASRFTLRDGRTGFLFVFAHQDRLPNELRELPAQKALLIRTFARDGWSEWPEIESHLRAAKEIYFDAVSQVEMPAWWTGRVALVGDAAYCPSLLAGEGSAFAMAGAYILAGELGRSQGDYRAAFELYEKAFRPFIERKQKSARAFAGSFTPATSLGLAIRDVVLHLTAIPAVADYLMHRFVSDRFTLPDYGDAAASA
jgi:2-polyprenyl-6-methoxyphenol hydroxylase-like FAD-dependent oxidoreductase